ncbi:MAG: hypothetical protein JXE06_02205 [Coriobacteriia bacterium]|nr:hypothetical protein [Coriobacteriia bacterium]MBN2821644.1 hypothetical protein [Coriobacteriia bacterium]
MAEFTEMTVAAAEMLRAEQPYEHRIHVSLVGKHGGFQPVPVLSASDFVKVTTGLNPVFSTDVLARWVTERLGDAELGEAIVAECKDLALFDQASVASKLVAERLAQANEVLGIAEPAMAEA